MNDKKVPFRSALVDENELTSILKTGEYNKQDAGDLLYILNQTNDKKLISMLCIALGNLKYNEAIPYMIKLLSNEITKNRKGRVLYAIKQLKYERYLPEIFRISNDDFSFEAFNMIYLMVNEYKINKDSKIYLRESLLIIESKELKSVFMPQIEREIKSKLLSPIGFAVKKIR